ncbi:RDD family protein [Natrinema salinisoli]|uniref:RDD family protein n=1 Tax=Natrinema salinisoli TaxID=2878535 RepID=UPI001CEFC924|nr:RDD family protein [Natrinema salinisoli]
MTKLRIFGSVHFNTRSVVEDDLREFSEGADAIAVEQPQLGETPRSAVGLVLRYPFFFIGLQLLFVFVQIPLLALFNRDLRSVEQIAVREVAQGRPIHRVDRHPLGILSERSHGWIVGNWLAFAALAVWLPTETLVATGLAIGLLVVVTVRALYGIRLPTVAAAVVLTALAYWLLIVDPFMNDMMGGLVALTFLIAGLGLVKITLEARNEVMLEDVATLAAANDYERICLATGYNHVPGMVERASAHGLTTVDVFKPAFRATGQMLDPEAVLESDGTDVRPDMETAGSVLFRRAGATGIDWLVIAVIAVAFPVVLVATDSAYPLGSDALLGGLILLWCLLSPPAYFVVGEAKYGQTLGKSLLDLTVVRIDGSPSTPGDAIIRTVLHPLDFLPIGYVLGAIVVATTDHGQRLGDLVAGTTVVKTEKVPEASTVDDENRSPNPGVPRVDADDSVRPRTTDR